MKQSKYFLGSGLLTIALAMPGCTASTDAGQPNEVEDTTVASHQAIINGTPVSTDRVGTPLLHNDATNEYCTSTLLRDRWVLTAYHCISIGGLSAPMADKKKITVGSTKVMPAEMYSMAPLNSVPNIDVALIKLSSSLPAPSGHVEPWDTPIYSGSSSSLVGNTYYCQGRGYNSCSTHVLALQSANLKAEYLQDEGFVMLPNSSGQIQMAGDSGSSS